jgi:aerobic-type carbon monoxide dehydrogenase small subunit (CoxS/CutS family)
MSGLVLEVNGAQRSVEARGDDILLWVLRNGLNLTGTRFGCGEGQCGACTVLVGGRPVRSCRETLSEVVGSKITTIEGLEQNGRLHPVQQAFLDVEAFQCGYCTSGMIVAAAGLLAVKASPNHEDITAAMAGNICRCGTYPRILEAVARAAAAMKKGASR